MIDANDEQTGQERIDSSRFLSQLYRTIEKGLEKEAMRLIYDYFYKLRMHKDIALCDRILDELDETRLSAALLVALLTITAPLKKNLRNRVSFFDRARNAIVAVRGDEAADRILIGLD